MSDKFFSQVQLLCGFNGADGATSFTDESSAARTATFTDNAQLDTAQARYGSASLLLDGVGDRVTFADNAAFTLATSAFTLEAWIRFSSTPGAGQQTICSHYNATGSQRGWFLGYDNTSGGRLRFLYSTNGTNTNDVGGAWVPVANTWYFVSATRSGADLHIHADGALITTANVSTNSIFNSTAAFQIGTQSLGTNDFAGWVDELRFTVGTARYSGANYRPPRGPFDRRKNTGVLNSYRQPVIVF